MPIIYTRGWLGEEGMLCCLWKCFANSSSPKHMLIGPGGRSQLFPQGPGPGVRPPSPVLAQHPH